MTRWLTGVGLVLVVALAGCSDPYASESREPKPRPSATATAQQERPASGDAVAPVASPGSWQPPLDETAVTRSPESLARTYARIGINWDWRTLTQRLELAQPLAEGALLDDLIQTAEEARTDESLERDRIGSRGRVVSVTVKGTGPTRRVVVVTREQEIRDGHTTLEGPRTRVYTGKARQTAAGWHMADWQLEP